MQTFEHPTLLNFNKAREFQEFSRFFSRIAIFRSVVILMHDETINFSSSFSKVSTREIESLSNRYTSFYT